MTKHQIIFSSKSFASLQCSSFQQSCTLQNQDRKCQSFSRIDLGQLLIILSIHSWNKTCSAQLDIYIFVLQTIILNPQCPSVVTNRLDNFKEFTVVNSKFVHNLQKLYTIYCKYFKSHQQGRVVSPKMGWRGWS